jgi:hypothetical protein
MVPIPVVKDALDENLRHCLKAGDGYVLKTAAICNAKLYAVRRVPERMTLWTLGDAFGPFIRLLQSKVRVPAA